MEHDAIRRARQEGAPLIDPETGQVTFVWRGKTPPQLNGDFDDWGAPGSAEHPPVGLAELEPGLWVYTLTLPRDAYIEYAFVLNGRRVPDPLNPHSTPNGMGEVNNFFYMPEAASTSLAVRDRRVAHGVLAHHFVEAGDLVVGTRRSVYLYQPPVSDPCSLMVVLDGRDYLRRAKLPNIVDNLIAQGRIQPIALAMVDSSPSARFIEYACSEATLSFLLEIVIPYAREHLNLLDVNRLPGAYGVMGASMGGVMALYAGARAPEVFGSVLSQSGAFGMPNHDFVIFDLLRQSSVKPLRIWLDAGRYEGLLECNRRMNQLLVGKGYNVTYREYSGGHNYPCWREDVWRGLEALYG
ncbi:MAG TPA: alpha/beta hydrolase-fold protein [Anaerolineae bacterium]